MLALFSGLYHLIWCPWDPVLVQERPWGKGYLQQLWQLGHFVLHVPKTGLGMGQALVWEWDKLRTGNGTS